jgi:hypothetical protein
VNGSDNDGCKEGETQNVVALGFNLMTVGGTTCTMCDPMICDEFDVSSEDKRKLEMASQMFLLIVFKTDTAPGLMNLSTVKVSPSLSCS